MIAHAARQSTHDCYCYTEAYSGALRHGSGEFCTFVHAFTYLLFTDKPLNFGL